MVNMGSDESKDNINFVLPTSKNLTKGQYVIVEYQGKRECKYYVSVITDVDEEEKLYQVTFKRYGIYSFLQNEKNTDEIWEGYIVGTVQPPAVKQKKDEILYSFDLSLYDDYKVE